jgi:hypothetical protein
MDADTLKILGDLSALGILALFIILLAVGYRITLSFLKDQVIPLASNHLKHIEVAFDNLSDSYEELKNEFISHNNLTETLVTQAKVQNELLKTHSELLRGELKK